MAKILVVDDDENVRGLLHTLLKRKGHHVFTANQGQRGIDVFRQDRPDVTILDFEMPDMDGLGVLRGIRAIDPQAPVIMLTGAGTEERMLQARALGVTHFLAKGFSLHELGAALNLILVPSDQRTSAEPEASAVQSKFGRRQ